MFWISGFVLCFVLNAFAAEPHLEVQQNHHRQTFTRSALLQRAKRVFIQRDPHYLRPFTFEAVPARDLFSGLKLRDDQEVEFTAADGFAGTITAQRLLNSSAGGAIAYVAVEKPDHPWPAPKKELASLGPFYLIWVHPERSKIVVNDWPAQLLRFTVKDSFASDFPKLVPGRGASDEVQKGFSVFRNNCFSCHMINGQGVSRLGPDLNVPMSPLQYFEASALKKFIRHPEQVRSWPLMRMPGFSELTEADLSNLLEYLRDRQKMRPVGQ